MNENDKKLIEQFFRESALQQVEDNGFTERVMTAIRTAEATPEMKSSISAQRLSLFSSLWTVFCMVVALVVFYLSNGWQALTSYATMLLTYVEVFLRTAPTFIDLSLLGSQGSAFSLMGQAILVLLTMMILFFIGLTRWAYRQV